MKTVVLPATEAESFETGDTNMSRSRGALWWTVLITTAVASRGALAQGAIPIIECARPAGEKCRLELKARDPREFLTVRVRDAEAGQPLPNVLVTFRSQAGGIIGSENTNGQGLATVEFVDKSVTADLVVTATATIGRANLTRSMTLVALPPQPSSTWSIGGVHYEYQSWYADRQLLNPVSADVVGPTDSLECNRAVVKFKALTDGSSAFPDSAQGVWNGKKCFVSTRWHIGKEIGEHTLRAEVLESSSRPRDIVARARALPRMVGGLGLRFNRNPRDYRVESTTIGKLTISGAAGQFSRDSITQHVDSARPSQFSPILGIDWAPFVGMARLRNRYLARAQDGLISKTRIMVGINPNDAKDEWMVGLSALQPFWGFQHEAASFDVYLVAAWRRRSEITNLETCRNDLATCKSESPMKFGGIRGVVLIDGTSLLKEVVGLFPVF